LISDQNSRVASLLSGKVDGAYLEVESWLQVNSQAPGKFRIAIDYAKEFPQVQYSTFTVRRLWAQQNPEIVKDFIRALLNANRRLVGHPDVLQEEIVKYFPADASSAKNWAQIIGGLGVWEVNGSLTAQNVQSTVDYLASKGSFSANTKANDVSDLSYLNAVLDEIGRQ
jgi:ABC-type nitrate/sulfonate/bicarbonate transport system substrate-binding protein